MPEQITIQHYDFTAEQLSNLIDERSMPIRRGVHVGNQEPHDLFIECYLPVGVDVLAADTINGNDRDSRPRQIRLSDRSVSIAPERYKNKLVNAIPVMEDAHDRIRDYALPTIPRAGESVGSFHMRAVMALAPNNPPVLVSKFFAAHKELYEEVMKVAHESSDVRRAADRAGSIRDTEKSVDEEGIFGLDDVTSAEHGLLPSLNVMMAMDMLSAIAIGADRSLHLGASGMAIYSKDARRMQVVKKMVRAVADEVALDCPDYTYIVTNVTSFRDHIDSKEHTSQHELLRSRAGI